MCDMIDIYVNFFMSLLITTRIFESIILYPRGNQQVEISW